MATGNSGSFTLTGSQNFAVIINWAETYNESANTHVVSITSRGATFMPRTSR